MDVRKIDPLDVEEFFRWCRQGGGDYRAISNNTIIKVSSLLNGMYQWMLKAPKRYGATSNPVEGADALKEEFFEGVSLSVDELNDLISYMLHNENDSSIFVLIGLAVLAGLRRGEICGLRWGDNTHVSICLNHDVNPFMVAASVGHVFSTKEMGVTGRVYWHDDGNRKESSKWISGRLCKTISGKTDGRKKDISQKESGKGDLPRTA